MGLLVDVFEVFGADMGVDLGGGNILVAEHFLNAAQVTTAIQQMSSKGMAEGVRADLLMQSGLLDPFADDMAGSPVGEPQAPVVEKKRRCLSQAGGSALNVAMNGFLGHR